MKTQAHMKALLVSPLFPLTYWGFQHSLDLVGKKAALPPLGLLTLAAMLPKNWSLRLVDLNVSALRNEDLAWADLVLTGGMLIQVESMHHIIARAHAAGRRVAVGGPAPTSSPELFDDADVVFRGEAEGRIDELVCALAQSSFSHRILDAPKSFPELESLPPPRFDLLELPKYTSLSLQFSRGCPFRCEFCDIVEIFGHSPRVKTVEQVLGEFEAIHELGYKGSVFFVDDNFIGNKAAVRRLLPAVKQWQRSKGQPFELYTESSVDLASDPALMRDMVEAGFTTVFVGIETPSVKALEQTGKVQNLRLDLSQAVERITRSGLEVMGGFIVGFDSDGADIFALQRAFLEHQPIPLAMVGLLSALPSTALWRRLETEGRLLGSANGDPFSRPNFTPAMDTRVLLVGYAKLLAWLYSPNAYYHRCETYLDQVGSRPKTRPATADDIRAFLRSLWHIGVRSPRRLLFWRLLARSLPSGLARTRQAVVHAVQGEHLIRYTDEHVLPRLARSLAELSTEAAHRVDAVPTPTNARALARAALCGTVLR